MRASAWWRRFARWPQPVVDMVQPMPYTALQSMLDGGGPKGIRGYFKAEFMDELSDEAIDKVVRHGGRPRRADGPATDGADARRDQPHRRGRDGARPP